MNKQRLYWSARSFPTAASFSYKNAHCLCACCCSAAKSCLTLCNPMDCSTISRSLLKLMSIELVMPFNYLILCHPHLISPSSFPASGSFPMSWLFASGGQSFSFNISPSKEYSGLIFFRIDWFDLLLSKGTLKKSSTPQFKSINSLALSLLYGPTLTSVRGYWKNHSFDCTDLCWQNDISAF